MTRGLGLRTALGERGSQLVGIWTSNSQQEAKEERKRWICSSGGFRSTVYGLSIHSISKGLCNEKLRGSGRGGVGWGGGKDDLQALKGLKSKED